MNEKEAGVGPFFFKKKKFYYNVSVIRQVRQPMFCNPQVWLNKYFKT